MRIVLISVYIFINLLMFGMCGYIYIVWSHYWKNKHRYLYPPSSGKHARHQDKQTLVEYFDDNVTQVPTQKREFKPSFPNATQYGVNYLADKRMLLEFKRKIIIRLRSVLFEESSLTRLQKENPYDVNFVEPMHNHNMSPEKLLCELRDAMSGQVKPLRPEDVEDPELRRMLTTKPLFGKDEHYEKCAIVSNAGALRNSYLGAEIDKHDLVLRFNHAPTIDHEVDVGTKTTIRILNSQVASKPEFDFTSSSLYKNIKILIWDPMPFRGTLQVWLRNPEFNFFRSFIKYKSQHPDSNVAIVNPEELWKLWMYLQQHTYSKMRLNPPSSGYLGLALLLPHCSTINMFEFVPSHRMTSTCHYFSPLIDSTCTTGVWHPLAAEKLLYLALNTASDETVFNKGYVTIAGYSTLKC
ncbi:beta-galactoside alpha-2,6-sialyltransferase 2 [Diaphorina citri]|uniref:Beta-galactoside alpha-2,6-sialyltransferase 1 n=1 Tax=Diaphorina citri TaxID=121845 RepID=A0A1S3D4D3_DIACI|nr:beta-galactoside alpha-2,6-sialyltransferase 2 [Diaphorina citri]